MQTANTNVTAEKRTAVGVDGSEWRRIADKKHNNKKEKIGMGTSKNKEK